MKNLILFVISCTSFQMYSQNLTIDCEFEKSGINFFYQRISSSVFQVSSNGRLVEVLLFGNEEEASLFMMCPREIFKPQNSFDIKGIRILTNSYSGVEYYGPYQYKTGEIKRIGDVFIEHYGPNLYHTGRIEQIGKTRIYYYSPKENNSERLKSIRGKDDRIKLVSRYSSN